MLRDDQTRPHRTTVLFVRNEIKASYGMGNDIAVATDIDTLDAAHEAHIRAHNAFNTSNTDETMINLIGTWSRMSRIINHMDDKYGRRE